MENSSRLIDAKPLGAFKARPNRRQRRSAETRERIVNAALKLFSERGVAATTVEDITDAADVGKGTFFNYFPGKEHIIAHLCRSQMGKIREYAAHSLHSSEPIESVLYKIAVIITKKFADSPSLARSLLVPAFSHDSARDQMAGDLKEDRKILAELMAARQERREVRGDITPTQLALQFQRVFFGTTVLWSLSPTRPLSDCLKETAGVLWSGIRAGNTPV